MVNSQNVVIIVEKMIEVLRTTSATDEFLRKLLVERIMQISEKYPFDTLCRFHFSIFNIFIFNESFVC